mgnify:CR=1 FL=1
MFTLPLTTIRLSLLVIMLSVQPGMLAAQTSDVAANQATGATDEAAAVEPVATDSSADASSQLQQGNSEENDATITPDSAAATAGQASDAASSPSAITSPEQQELPALTLVAQPIYPQYLAASVYTPLVDYLAQGLGRDIELITPKNFQAHWSAIKSAVQHDLALEEAPLTDYRMHYQQYQPLVQAASSQSYSLAVLDSSYEDRFDLVGRPVASLAAPSSAYLFLTRWYDNPLNQPQIISTATSYADAVQQLWGGEVVGVVLPTELATDYPQFSFIATSESIPGLAITATPKLDNATVTALIDLLLALNQEQFIAILDELNIDRLEPADAQHYRGYAEWIRSVSYTGFD